ncbi:MAG: hypothetical protein KAR21_08950 [Spirochaetales bacterium]|nr:hypothetical protein [Spirochaetales bacterium]
MAPYIRQVHLKGPHRIKIGKGFGHIGVAEEEDDSVIAEREASDTPLNRDIPLEDIPVQGDKKFLEKLKTIAGIQLQIE